MNYNCLKPGCRAYTEVCTLGYCLPCCTAAHSTFTGHNAPALLQRVFTLLSPQVAAVLPGVHPSPMLGTMVRDE